jgi:integrase
MRGAKRGFGSIYQPTYSATDGQQKHVAIWWIQYWWRGRRFRESSGSPNRADAVRLLERRFGEIGRGRLIGPSIEKTTFEHLKTIILDDYRVNGRRSLETVEGSLKALETVFGDDYARDITLDRLNAYVARRLENGRKPATIVNELAVLRRAFRLAERSGRAICPPFPQIRVQNTRQGFFEEAAFRAVLDHLPGPVKPIAEFGYLTGWRLGEIMALEWRQVDFRAGTVRLEPGTTKEHRGPRPLVCRLPPPRSATPTAARAYGHDRAHHRADHPVGLPPGGSSHLELPRRVAYRLQASGHPWPALS